MKCLGIEKYLEIQVDTKCLEIEKTFRFKKMSVPRRPRDVMSPSPSPSHTPADSSPTRRSQTTRSVPSTPVIQESPGFFGEFPPASPAAQVVPSAPFRFAPSPSPSTFSDSSAASPYAVVPSVSPRPPRPSRPPTHIGPPPPLVKQDRPLPLAAVVPR